jgi:hypothetical protein
LERKRPSTALPIAESLEVDAVSLTSPSGEAVRIVDEGAGAFSLVFEKKAWFYGPFRMVTVDTQLYRLKAFGAKTLERSRAQLMPCC